MSTSHIASSQIPPLATAEVETDEVGTEMSKSVPIEIKAPGSLMQEKITRAIVKFFSRSDDPKEFHAV